jgi:hypothetical protein
MIVLASAEFFLCTEAAFHARIDQGTFSDMFETISFDALDADDLDDLNLGVLYGVITGRPYKGDALNELMDELSLRRGQERDPTWFLIFPRSFTDALAAASRAQLDAAAVRWAAEEGIWSNKVSADDLRELVGELAAVAHKAVTSRQQIFVRMSY